MITVDENKSRDFYPWNELKQVGDYFTTTNKYAHQLAYMKNKANTKIGLEIKYKAKKSDDGYRIYRIS